MTFDFIKINIRPLPKSPLKSYTVTKINIGGDNVGFLEDFYISGIMPSEIKGRTSGAYLNLQRKIENANTDFINSLSEEQRTAYENLFALISKSHFQEEVSTFVSGFKLGSQFIISTINLSLRGTLGLQRGY